MIWEQTANWFIVIDIIVMIILPIASEHIWKISQMKQYLEYSDCD